MSFLCCVEVRKVPGWTMIVVLMCDMNEDIDNLVRSKYRGKSVENSVKCILKKNNLGFCITLKCNIVEFYPNNWGCYKCYQAT